MTVDLGLDDPVAYHHVFHRQSARCLDGLGSNTQAGQSGDPSGDYVLLDPVGIAFREASAGGRIFACNGMRNLIYDAILNQDFAVIQGLNHEIILMTAILRVPS
jgi:hypothetical protein